jgi:hypothetical protein
VHELMKGRATAEKCAVIDPNVTGKQAVVSDDDVVSDLAIMTDVRTSHQKVLITNFCGAGLGGAAMNGAVFTDDVVVADLDLRFSLGRKRYILRRRTDDRAVSDKIPEPIVTFPSMTTCDCTIVLSPIVTCDPTIENGPISALAPIFALGSTIAVG